MNAGMGTPDLRHPNRVLTHDQLVDLTRGVTKPGGRPVGSLGSTPEPKRDHGVAVPV